MIILKPIAHETIWGGRTLAKYFDEPHSNIGHMYSLFDDATCSNIIMNGRYAGRTVHDYFWDVKDSCGLGMFDYFPLVLAIVEASDNLSIQVHPDDIAAKELEGAKFGKNESWYFLKRPDDGYIYNGCKVKDKSKIRELVENTMGGGGTISDTLSIEAGDYVYVPSGTLHAMTRGSMVFEIEENSEYTYRLYDFDRTDKQGNKRELHIDKALKALKPELKSTTRKYEQEISERLYATSIITPTGYVNESQVPECFTILDENANVTLEDIPLRFGMTIIAEPGERINIPATAMRSRILSRGRQ